MLAEVYLGRRREGRHERAHGGARPRRHRRSRRIPPDRMSGGQQQRVAIARALLGEPSLLLCDEPTGNLDSVTTASALELFDELGDEGMTILIITHDSDVAERMPRRTRIVDGQLTEQP